MTAWLKDYVNGLTIAPEGRLRMDCPACAKKNTFSVSDTNGERCGFVFMQTVGFVDGLVSESETTHPTTPF